MKEVTHTVLVFSLLFLLLPVVSAAGMDLVTLQEDSLETGEELTLELRAEGEDIAGYSAEIAFSGNRLDYLNASGTPSFSNPVVNSQENRIILAGAEATGTTDPVLARLRFELVDDSLSRTALNITDAYLNTPSKGIDKIDVRGEMVRIKAPQEPAGDNSSVEYVKKVVVARKNVSVQSIREMSGVSVDSIYRGQEVLVQVNVSVDVVDDLEDKASVKRVRDPKSAHPDEQDVEVGPSRSIIDRVIGFLNNLFGF